MSEKDEGRVFAKDLRPGMVVWNTAGVRMEVRNYPVAYSPKITSLVIVALGKKQKMDFPSTYPFYLEKPKEEEIGVQVARFEVEDTEDQGWCVIGRKGRRHAVISKGHVTEEEAQDVRNQLIAKGYAYRPDTGVRVVPGGWEEAIEGLPRIQGRGRLPRAGGRPSDTTTRSSKVTETKKRTPAKKMEPKPKAAVEEAPEPVAEEEAPKETKPKVDDKERAEQGQKVVDLRHDKKLSWRLIAQELGLGSPGKARKLYTEATGKPHNEAPTVERITSKPKSERVADLKPVFPDDATDDDILAEVRDGCVITIRNSTGVADVRVSKIVGVSYSKKGDRVLKFTDDNQRQRTPGVQQIVRVR